MTDSEREFLRLLRSVIRGEPVDWTELYRVRAIVAAELGIVLEHADGS
jgi:hypothetical protein